MNDGVSVADVSVPITKLRDLKPDLPCVSVLVKVVYQKVIVEKRRKDGTAFRVAEFLVADDTAQILLRTFRAPATQIVPGSTLILSDVATEVFDGFLRLKANRWTKIQSAPDESLALSVEQAGRPDLSLVEYGQLAQHFGS